MRLTGVPAGPFIGRDAISRAYAEQPPADTITVAAVDSAGPSSGVLLVSGRSPPGLELEAAELDGAHVHHRDLRVGERLRQRPVTRRAVGDLRRLDQPPAEDAAVRGVGAQHAPRAGLVRRVPAAARTRARFRMDEDRAYLDAGPG